MKRMKQNAALPLAALGVALLACEVTNPGAILDVDLDNELVMQALVTGMSSDFSEGFDDLAFSIARGSDEVTGSGSYGDTGTLRRGIVDREVADGEWSDLQRARWVAEQGLVRMKSVLEDRFDGNKLTARGYFLAALSNRVLGECFCEMTFDGGPLVANTEAFRRALPQVDSALIHALQFQLANPGDTANNNLITAARGVFAQAYLALGDWTNAATYAAMVPTTFVYQAVFSTNSARERNVLNTETYNRTEFSTWGSYVGSLSPADPRAPWRVDPAGRKGADGTTVHWQQQKYTSQGSDIPVVKGTEMRLIQAEARLVANDASSVTDAMNFINQVRQRHSLSNLSAANIQEAWTHLDRERLLTLWLEARRWFDLRRWDAAGNLSFLPGIQHVYGLTSVKYQKDPSISKRATCFPIPQDECDTNVNLQGKCQ